MIKYDTAIFSIEDIIANIKNTTRLVLIEFFKDENLDLPLGYKDKVKGMDIKELSLYVTDYCGLSDVDSVYKRIEKIFIERYKTKVKIRNGIYEYLVYLKEKGIKIGLICPYIEKMYTKFLEINKINNLFNSIIYDKGDSAYDVCLDSIGGKKDGVVCFFSNMKQLEMIKSMDMNAILVNSRGIYDNIDEMLEKSDDYITDFRELII